MNTTIKKRIEEINSGRVPEGYEKTSFGIFPCDWEKSKTLKDLGKFGKGRGIPGNKLISEGVPCVGYGDIYMKYNYHFEKAQSFVDENTAAESQKIRKGTLLFTATGETAEEIGKCVCYNGEEDIYAGGDIITFVPDRINSMFIAYQQYQNYALRQKASFGQGHSVVHIQKDRLEKLHIAYPQSSQEQSRIAEILMQWDKAIELQEKLIKSYQNLKKYYLSKMFPKKGSLYPEIRFAGFTEPWEVRKLGELCKITSGFMGDSQLTNGKFRLTKIETISDGFVDESRVGYSDVKPSINYLLKPGDILYSNINSLSHMGKVAKYQGKSELYHGINLLRLSPNELIKSEFLFQMLNTERKRNWAKSHANKAVNQASINQTLLASQEVFVCGLYEQKLIGNYFANFDNYILFCLNILDKLIKQRKALQQYLLTGIVRV